jgi:hypothetical protein
VFTIQQMTYGNIEPRECNGTSLADGEGIIFDTFDGTQGGLPHPYSTRAVAENNIVVGNIAKSKIQVGEISQTQIKSG